MFRIDLINILPMLAITFTLHAHELTLSSGAGADGGLVTAR